ncbi:MAG: DinB family protein [Bacteroidetes bacterium]|nr:MAG: DinB family protein [Bacteroidota bacterium]
MPEKLKEIAPPYFKYYLELIPEGELTKVYLDSIEELKNQDLQTLEAIGEKVYAPGKWTIRDLFQHLIDTERILCYRALCFARNEQAQLPSFDEDAYVEASHPHQKSIEQLIQELMVLRESSLLLFEGMSGQHLRSTGTMMKATTSVYALALFIIGHAKHHLNILQERYYPIIQHS